MEETKNKAFPKDFLWGAAISSYQAEGGNRFSDWWAWEMSEKRMAQLQKNGKNPEEFRSGKASEFRNLFEQDLQIAKDLKHNAFRLSIEWARIEPEPGKLNYKELEYYHKVLSSARSKGMKTFLTLHHFTLPEWFAEKKGFVYHKNIPDFTNFSKLVAEKLGHLVDFWITFNEPEVYAQLSYLLGRWPPARANWTDFISVRKNLVAAHRIAYAEIKQVLPQAQIGFAKHAIYFETARWNLVGRIFKFVADTWWNKSFVIKNLDRLDFIGVNYYFHKKFTWRLVDPPVERYSDMRWPLSPEGFYGVLSEMKNYDKPIYVTEHGLADAADRDRSWYIRSSLEQLLKAREKGVDVRGYLHWSLLDNFEWDNGFDPRFGLVEVDYRTYERKVRQSAKDFAKIIEQGYLI